MKNRACRKFTATGTCALTNMEAHTHASQPDRKPLGEIYEEDANVGRGKQEKFIWVGSGVS